MRKNDCTVLIMSCDKYDDLWNPFFKLFSIFWKDCPFAIKLSTEKKSYKSDYVDVEVINSRHLIEVPWSRRLKECLKTIKTKYVIILLDDFFLKEYVDINKIDECYRIMEANKEIAVFSFVPSVWADLISPYKGYVERPMGAYYRVNCQAAIWNREKLMKLICTCENAWDFEWRASCRADKTDWKFYASSKEEPWVFDYNYNSGGGGVHRGKWSVGVREVFEKYGIEIDYSIRGWDDQPAVSLSEDPIPNPIPDIVSASLKGNLLYIIRHFQSFIAGYLP